MTKKRQYRAVKYAGDDLYSWAVFRAADIKGLRSPISGLTKAKPILTGMGMGEARREADYLESKWEEKNALQKVQDD